MTPRRIQRQRTKGWRMPPDARYVGRPTRWGNPYRIGDPDPMLVGRVLDAAGAVRMFRWYLASNPQLVADAQRELAGHALACWCELVDKDGTPVPCHADVWLRVANGGAI